MDPAAGEGTDNLAAYALGGLDPAAVAAVRRHAAHCRDCRRQLDDFAEVKDVLDPVPLDGLLDNWPDHEDIQLRQRNGAAMTGADLGLPPFDPSFADELLLGNYRR